MGPKRKPSSLPEAPAPSTRGKRGRKAVSAIPTSASNLPDSISSPSITKRPPGRPRRGLSSPLPLATPALATPSALLVPADSTSEPEPLHNTDPAHNSVPVAEASSETTASSKVLWTSEMTGKLLDMLRQAILDGRRSDNGYKMDVWNEIAESIIKDFRFPGTLTGKKCQSRLDTLKKEYDVWNRLRVASGWHCDPSTGMIGNDDDQVWKEEIEAASNKGLVRQLQTEPLPFCWELDFIFSGITATGARAFYSQKITKDLSNTGRLDAKMPISPRAVIPTASRSGPPPTYSQTRQHKGVAPVSQLDIKSPPH
ncbi:hypothetical protein BJ508DRAFT_309836 [Ascobolus immersus RN42]|uniref:Myb/SANT-like domain-containing protein n=1 Tax=Ascobolus immersus RN42 TaxID=1160509 RepID=A0A3N4HV58_ASCIM|nr:hypothetical protein BJ508DRAFT_309836 [Ascobolus immersus RN42]